MKKLSLIGILLLTSFMAKSQDIFDAARNNDVKTIQSLVAQGVPVDTVNDRGFTPLVLAVYNDGKDAVKLLLSLNADVNAQDLSGNTALMGAAFKGLPAMAELLILHKANVNKTNFNHASPLTFAATFGQLEIARQLLRHGADKTLRDSRGKTALEYAEMQENSAMIDLLKE
jgi:ankyrin repeat protein